MLDVVHLPEFGDVSVIFSFRSSFSLILSILSIGMSVYMVNKNLTYEWF